MKKKIDLKSILIVLLVLLNCALVIGFVVYVITRSDCSSTDQVSNRNTANNTGSANNTESPKKEFPACKNDKIIINPDLDNEDDIFRQLTLKELKNIEVYVATNKLGFLRNIELYIPDKDAALDYLDKNGSRPDRRARVTVFVPNSTIIYYVIRPMPNASSHELAKFNDRTNPMTIVDLTKYKTPKMAQYGFLITTKMWPLFRDTYDVLKGFNTSLEAYQNGLKHSGAVGTIQSEGEVQLLIIWRFKQTAGTSHLNVLNMISVSINFTSANPDEWLLYKVTYHLKAYKDIESLMETYTNGTLKVIKVKRSQNENFESNSLKRRGSQANYFPSSEPLLLSPNGPRFSVRGQLINYLDWQFNYLVRSSTGPALFDVRFKGQRIAFEISLQEAASFYSTGSPYMNAVNYLDSQFFLGLTTSLIHGIDCPQHSIYLDVVLYLGSGSTTIKNAICVFEDTSSVPLRRHHHSNKDGSFFYGGMADATLVIRYISDMNHYDYIHDFIFHQNGAIQVKTSTTGHLLVEPFFPENNDQYGFEVVDNFLGGMHDHFLFFKVDLDILGTKNSFKSIDVNIRKISDPWDSRATFKKYLTHHKRKNESDAAIKYNFDHPEYYIVYNENEKNKYGNVRGYRIMSAHKIKQVYADNHWGTKALEWSKYQLSVSKFKETERCGSCMYNGIPQYETPLCSFDARILDNENIENEDLVAWIPMGGLHIPVTEDFPTTSTVANQFSFFIKPFNYFDEDPSFSSLNSVHIEKKGNLTNIETYGTPESGTCGTPKRYIK